MRLASFEGNAVELATVVGGTDAQRRSCRTNILAGLGIGTAGGGIIANTLARTASRPLRFGVMAAYALAGAAAGNESQACRSAT
jgi:hypothetical protein